MIVQCPECASQYRIQDSKIPDSGGRISCPNCGHSFVVYPDGANEGGSSQGETSVANSNRLASMAEGMEGEDVDPSMPSDSAPTEVMSGNDMPAFVSGGNNQQGQELQEDEDGTIEMRNPFLDEDAGPPPGVDSTDMLEQGGFEDDIDDWDDGGFDSDLGADDSFSGDDGGPSLQTYTGGQGDGVDRQSSGPQGGGSSQNVDVRVQGGGGQQQQGGWNQGGGQQQGQQPMGGQPQPQGQGSGAHQTGGMGPGQGGAADAGGGGPAPGHDGPWKLRAQHGLTYEFPETEALRNWLTDREGIAEFDLSADGSNFHGLADFPQVADLVGGGQAGGSQQVPSQPASRQQQPSQPMSQSQPQAGGQQAGAGMGSMGNQQQPGGGGQQGAASSWNDALGGGQQAGGQRQKVSNDGFELPSRDAAWNKLLYAILAFLVVVAIGIFLDVSGTYPVGQYIPGVPSTFDNTGEQAASLGSTSNGQPGGDQGKAGAEKAEDEQEDEGSKQINQVLGQAQKAIENNRLQTAIEKLSAAKLLDPKNARTYDMLADVYEKLGQKDKAKKNREKAESLRGGDDGEEAGDKEDKKDEESDKEAGEASD